MASVVERFSVAEPGTGREVPCTAILPGVDAPVPSSPGTPHTSMTSPVAQPSSLVRSSQLARIRGGSGAAGALHAGPKRFIASSNTKVWVSISWPYR